MVLKFGLNLGRFEGIREESEGSGDMLRDQTPGREEPEQPIRVPLEVAGIAHGERGIEKAQMPVIILRREPASPFPI